MKGKKTKNIEMLFGTLVLALFLGCCPVKAGVPSQVTEFKPEVNQVTKSGTVTNSKGEEVAVTIVHPGVGMTKNERSCSGRR